MPVSKQWSHLIVLTRRLRISHTSNNSGNTTYQHLTARSSHRALITNWHRGYVTPFMPTVS